MQVIAPGEKAIYVCEDLPWEVTVIAYRFTPRGLVYGLVPEQEGAKWVVMANTLQPMHGFTRMLEVDLMTGEERDPAGASTTLPEATAVGHGS